LTFSWLEEHGKQTRVNRLNGAIGRSVPRNLDAITHFDTGRITKTVV
jgi:hypothetical protein